MEKEGGKMAEKTTVHFKLDSSFGQSMTDMAREKAWDDGHRNDAILFLMASMVGLPIEMAEEVIGGKKKFVTNDDRETCDFVEDTWEAPDLKKMEAFIDRVIGLIAPRSIITVTDTFRRETFIKRFGESCLELAEWKKENIVKAYRKAVLMESIWNEVEKDYRGEDISKPLNALSIVDRISMLDVDDEYKAHLIRVADGVSEARIDGVPAIIDSEYFFDTGWLNRDGCICSVIR